jgi:hypothetical protein
MRGDVNCQPSITWRLRALSRASAPGRTLWQVDCEESAWVGDGFRRSLLLLTQSFTGSF